MADFQYDISQLYNAAFGLNDALIRYNVGTAQEREQYNILFNKTNAQEIYEDNVFSSIGTPVAFPIKLKGGIYNLYQDGEIIEKRMADLMLPFTTLCDIRRGKVMNRTKVNGGKGTVKEVYGHDDWHIRFRGLILKGETFKENGITQAFPSNYMQTLKEWDDLVDSVDISGKIFEILDIWRINIVHIEFTQIKGAPNVRPFEIIAESDEPVELIL